MRIIFFVTGLFASITVFAGSDSVSLTCIVDHDAGGNPTSQIAPMHYLVDYKSSIITLNGGDKKLPGVSISGTNIDIRFGEVTASIDRITGFYRFGGGQSAFTGRCTTTPKPKF